MKKRIDNRIVYITLSFLIPLVILLVALIWLRVAPFGNKTLVISDADGLYINYLSYVSRMLKHTSGITYSFEKGLGGNMLPNIGITMLNPFFPIFACFSIRNYPVAFTLVCVLNFSLCGLTMYLLLADLYGHKRSNLIFSTTYALAGFNVANVFQVFFFTGVHVLPILVLGLRKLLRGQSPLLYIAAIAYAVLTSYYFGYMLCVASVLFFVLYLYLHRELAGKPRLFARYALSSLCGGLLGAVVWLPALLGIRGGRLNETGLSDFHFWENMPLLEIGAKLFTGANNTDELVNGLPNIYVGILPLALVILFFIDEKTESRKKCAAGAALGFYLLCFYICALNMVMHGGTDTNWFNYRYSFVFSFLLLLIASYEWQSIDTVCFEDCKRSFFFLLGLAILIFSKKYGFVSGGEVVLDFAILLLLYLAFHMYRTESGKNPKKAFELLVLLICSFQLLLNFSISVNNILKEEKWSAKVSEYQETVDAVAPLVNGLQRGGLGFYRMEVNRQRSGNSGNDPMLYGYNGIGHSGSYDRAFLRTALAKLGVNWFDTRNWYEEGIPAATDTLLGIRFIMAQEDLSTEKEYQKITDYSQIDLLKNAKNYDIYLNPDALPLAFLADKEIEAEETAFDDVFDNLNRAWSSISGLDRPVFIEETDISFHVRNIFEGPDLLFEDARAIVEKHDAEAVAKAALSQMGYEVAEDTKPTGITAYIEYSWIAGQDGSVYVYNRGMLNDYCGASPSVLSYLGNYQKGDTVTGYIELDSNYVGRTAFEEICGRFRAAYVDKEALQTESEAVRSRPCTIEKEKESHLQGTFTADAGKLLMFTIPYDEGWTCRIDGEKAQIKTVLGVFMAVDVPEGAHHYTMDFFPTGLKAGSGLTMAALVMTFMLLALDHQDRKRRSHSNTGVLAPQQA